MDNYIHTYNNYFGSFANKICRKNPQQHNSGIVYNNARILGKTQSTMY